MDAIVAAAEEEGRLLDKLHEADRPLVDEALAGAAAARRAIEAKGSREELEAYQISVIGICEDVAVADQESGHGTLSLPRGSSCSASPRRSCAPTTPPGTRTSPRRDARGG